MAFAPPELPRFPNPALAANLRAEREAIGQLVVDVDQQIRLMKRLHGDLTRQPYSSRMISGAILLTLVVFFVAVIYPLGWLPLSGPPTPSFAPRTLVESIVSFRGALLAAFAVIFTASMGYFWWTNNRLRYPEELLSQLKARTLRSWYSEYLGVLDANQRPEFGGSDPPA